MSQYLYEGLKIIEFVFQSWLKLVSYETQLVSGLLSVVGERCFCVCVVYYFF